MVMDLYLIGRKESLCGKGLQAIVGKDVTALESLSSEAVPVLLFGDSGTLDIRGYLRVSICDDLVGSISP